jgi:archaellum component FlaD/FlaE
MKFVEGLRALGYERLATTDELRRLRDHGVSIKFIEEMKQAGFDRVPLETLVRLRDHGVSAAYIQKLKSKGYNSLTLEQYIDLRDRGVN